MAPPLTLEQQQRVFQAVTERDQLEREINSLPSDNATSQLPSRRSVQQQPVSNAAPQQTAQRPCSRERRVPPSQSAPGRVQQIQTRFFRQLKSFFILPGLLILGFLLIVHQLPWISVAPLCSLCDISNIPLLKRGLWAPSFVKIETILPPLRLLHEIFPNNSLIIMPHQLWLIADNLTRYENAVLFSGLYSEEKPLTAGESSKSQEPKRVCEQIRVVRNSTRAVAGQIERWGTDAHRFNRDVARVIQRISHYLQGLITERRSLRELVGWGTVSRDHKDIWIRFFQNLYDDTGNLDQDMQSIIATLDILDLKKNRLLESTTHQITITKSGRGKAGPSYYYWGRARADKREKVARLEEQELLLRSLANHVVEARNVADRISRVLSSIKREIKHTQDLLSKPVRLLEASTKRPVSWKIELAEQVEKISQETQKLDEFERRQMAALEAYLQNLTKRKFKQDTSGSREGPTHGQGKPRAHGII